MLYIAWSNQNPFRPTGFDSTHTLTSRVVAMNAIFPKWGFFNQIRSVVYQSWIIKDRRCGTMVCLAVLTILETVSFSIWNDIKTRKNIKAFFCVNYRHVWLHLYTMSNGRQCCKIKWESWIVLHSVRFSTVHSNIDATEKNETTVRNWRNCP